MSVKCLTAVFFDVQNCSPSEKMVLLAIADNARDSGKAWPGIELIAKKASVTPRAVSSILARLEEKGELQIMRNWGPRGTNCYILNCVAKGRFDPPTRDEMDEGGDEAASPPLNGVHPPEAASPPGKTLGNQALPLNGVHPPEAASSRSERTLSSGEPLGTTEHTHTQAPGGGFTEIPDEQTVLKHAREYAGSLAKGIPAVIPERWAQAYFDWRQFTEEFWPRQWQEEMNRRFERDWVAGRPEARAGAPVTSAPKERRNGEGVWAVKQRLEQLKNAAAAHPANEASSAYCADVGPELTAEYERLQVSIRDCQKQLEGKHE